MSVDAVIREIETRVALARTSATLLVVVVDDNQRVDEGRRLLGEILRSGDLVVRDLGVANRDRGPAVWLDAARAAPADVYVISAAQDTALSGRAFANLVNAQREVLRDLPGPLVLLIPKRTEAQLREGAPDFVTWIAQSYVVPTVDELALAASARGATGSAAPTMTESAPPIRFLHLSDLHLRPAPTKRYDQDRVLGGLLAMLARDRESSPLDLIFLTGDLAQSGKAAEYEVAVAFLRDLLQATGVAKERLFVVPGNHDVDRDVGRWLLRTLRTDEASTDFFVDPASRRWHSQKFESWSHHLEGFLGARPLGLKVGIDAVEFVEVRGVRVAVASFNSAWFAQDDSDKEQLWLGEANVSRAGQHASRAALSVALMHHPTDYLHEVERSGVENHLERAFDLVLRGHLHKEKARVILGARGAQVEVAAPAACQGSQWSNGCFLGEIRVGARTIRLRPFAFGSGADPWVLDTKVFPDDVKDGYCRTYSLGGRAPIAGPDDPLVAKVTEAFWALDRMDRLALARQLGVTGASSREIEERAAEAVRRSPEAIDVWKELASKASAPRREEAFLSLANSFVEAARKRFHGAKIPRSDPQFLEKALRVIAALWGELAIVGHNPPNLTESVISRICSSLLEALVEAPVHESRALGIGLDGRSPPRVDIALGGDDEPPPRRAFVEISKAERRSGRGALGDGLIRLDYYLSAVPVAHAALVLFADRAEAPKIEHATTPGGRDVLVLYIS